MNKTRELDMLHGPLLGNLIRFALPIALSSMLQQLFNPPAVLAALNAAEPAENAPHILGLYVVQQIAAAHGGRAVVGQNTPCGAKTTVRLPVK